MMAFGFYIYIICMWYLLQYLVSTDDIVFARCLGRFSNYVTLKLLFFDPPTTHHLPLSRLFTRTLLRYVMLNTLNPLFFNYTKVIHSNFFTVTSRTLIKYHPLPLIYHHRES